MQYFAVSKTPISNEALKRFKELISTEEFTEEHLKRLEQCVRGNTSWSEVEAILEEYFSPDEIEEYQATLSE